MEINQVNMNAGDVNNANARWYDNAHSPTECGLYYQETGDKWGNPQPGLYLWKEGDKPLFLERPWKIFGPIRGALQAWPAEGEVKP